MRLDVGIGDFQVSNDLTVEIKTYALGSCVALIAWDSEVRVGGLIHLALPDSSINQDKAAVQPAYFVDTGIPLFLNALGQLGANRRTSYLKLVGGASVLDNENNFDIGRRNILAVKKVLWKYGMGIHKEDTGGDISRTVTLWIIDGKIEISNSNKKWFI
jgi:chemotaxis protein CheD